MTGFEAFRIFTSISLHFKSRDYHYERGSIPVKIETFYNNSNYDVFEQCLVRYNQQYLENLIVSNLVHSRGSLHPKQLKNKMAHKIKDKWEETLENIDQVFTAELLLLMGKYQIEDPYVLFEKIYKSINEQIYSDVVAVENIQEVIDDQVHLKGVKDNDFFLHLSSLDCHFLIILDALMKRFYNFSFFQGFIEKNPNVKEHPIIFCYKYACLLPVSELLNKPKIKMFKDCLS